MRRDHLHRVGEAELAQVGDLAADVVDRVAQDRRERRDHLHRVGEAELAQVGDLAADVVDRVAQDRRGDVIIFTGSAKPSSRRSAILPRMLSIA